MHFNQLKKTYMVQVNLEKLCQDTIKIVKEVGTFVAQKIDKVSSSDIETKDKNDLVSYVDKTAEKKLVEALQKLLPNSSFLVEEGTVERSESEWEWIIDPLDGTMNFLHNIPPFAISVGLSHNGTMAMGVVLEITRNECFYAWKGGGAYCNEKPIKISQAPDLAHSVVSTGVPYKYFSFLDEYLATLKYLILNAQAIRRHGAAAIDLCYVASGRFDTFFEFNLLPWDVAAASLIVQEAGGKVGDSEGKDDYIFGRSIVAANPNIYDDMIAVMQRYLSEWKTKKEPVTDNK